MPGDYLDLSSEPATTSASAPRSPAGREPAVQPASTDAAGRKFVGIHFVCCDVYSRIYINRAGTAYSGNCPRCAKRVDLKIGPGGTSQRFFTAG
jgi:hypothetical protein